MFGEWFTLTISDAIMKLMVPTLLNGRVDAFFDKQPVGRVLNRSFRDSIGQKQKTRHYPYLLPVSRIFFNS